MLLLKSGRVIDPGQNLDDKLDVLIDDENIVKVEKQIQAPAAQILDVSGMVVAPGFVDLHVHFREPGKEEAETIETGALAAAAGGFTTVACMPNTQPVNDNEQTHSLIQQKANEAVIQVLQIAAVTIGEVGKELAPLKKLRKLGVVAFSDDGKPVTDSRLMREALEICRDLSVPVIDHCEDAALVHGGVMNEGKVSAKLKLSGMPAEAEEIMVARNILLAKLTGGHVHLAHMSTAGSMKLIRQAKEEGISVTAEVTPHHFTLTEDAVAKEGTNAKMNPPLRTSADLKAVQDAIRDGTVDIIASDHAPHHQDTKRLPFADAPFGIVGLETSIGLGLDKLVHAGFISVKRFVELYSTNPAKIIGVPRGIQESLQANLTIFKLDHKWIVDTSKFNSKSRNTPFEGWNLHGAPMATIYKGNIVWKHPSI